MIYFFYCPLQVNLTLMNILFRIYYKTTFRRGIKRRSQLKCQNVIDEKIPTKKLVINKFIRLCTKEYNILSVKEECSIQSPYALTKGKLLIPSSSKRKKSLSSAGFGSRPGSSLEQGLRLCKIDKMLFIAIKRKIRIFLRPDSLNIQCYVQETLLLKNRFAYKKLFNKGTRGMEGDLLGRKIRKTRGQK